MKLKVLFYYYNIVNFTHTLNVLFITKLAFLCQFFNFEKCGRPGGGGLASRTFADKGGGRGLKWPKFCGRPLWTAFCQFSNLRRNFARSRTSTDFIFMFFSIPTALIANVRNRRIHYKIIINPVYSMPYSTFVRDFASLNPPVQFPGDSAE